MKIGFTFFYAARSDNNLTLVNMTRVQQFTNWLVDFVNKVIPVFLQNVKK